MQTTTKRRDAQPVLMTMLALSMLLASLGTSIANIALPNMASAFSAPFHEVQAVVIAYLAAMTISTVFAGRLGDRFGLRRMHLFGLALFAAASLLCAVAPDLWCLVGARLLQGAGAAFLMTLSMALVRETTSDQRIGRAMGLLGTMSALGTALGPTLGGVILPTMGWQGIFLAQFPPALAALFLAFVSLPRDAAKAHGAAQELRAAFQWSLAPNLIVNLLVAAVMMTTLVVGPFYLGTGLGLGEMMVGLVMAVGPIISIFGGVPAGRAVDSWSARRVLAAGLILLALGALLLAILPVLTGVAGYAVAIMILTPGYQLFQAANNTMTLADVPKEQRGTTSGLLALSRNLGLIGGASVMGAIFMMGTGTGDLTHASADAVTDGMRLTFLLAAALMALASTVTFRKRIADAIAKSMSTISARPSGLR